MSARAFRFPLGCLLAIGLVTAWGPVLRTDEPEGGERNIRAVLDQPAQVSFLATPLPEVVQFLSLQHNTPIVIDRAALADEAMDPVALLVTLQLGDVSLRSVLNHVLRPFDLTYVIADDVLNVTTEVKAEESMSVQVYSLAPLSDQGQAVDPDVLIDLITICVTPHSWVDNGGMGTLNYHPGAQALVVGQTEEVHRRVAALLAALGELPTLGEALAGGASREPIPIDNLGERAARIRDALQKPTTASFQGTPLSDAMKILSTQHEIPILIDNDALEDELLDPSALMISRELVGPRLASVLNLILSQYDLTAAMHDEALLVTTRHFAEDYAPNVIYPVGDLLGLPADADVLRVEQRLDVLEELIMRSANSGSWMDYAGSGTLESIPEKAVIVVSTTQPIHDQVSQLLAELRAAQAAAPTPADLVDELAQVEVKVFTRKPPEEGVEPEDPEKLKGVIMALTGSNAWREPSAYVEVLPTRIVVRQTRRTLLEVEKLLQDLGAIPGPSFGGHGGAVGALNGIGGVGGGLF